MTEKEEMAAILTLINSESCVESYRMSDDKCSLFALIFECDGYYMVMFQTRGTQGLYAKHSDEICSNNYYKTLNGARRKLRRMGFAA